MGISERKEREKQELRSRILEKATQIFIEEGFEKTSIRTIAERVEYSPATIYLHFKDKNELFKAIHDQCFDKLFEHLSQSKIETNPLKRLRKMGDLYLEFAQQNPEFYDLMFILDAPIATIKEANIAWKEGFDTFYLLRDTIKEAIEQAYIKPMDIDTTAFSIMSFVHGIASLYIRGRFIMFPNEHLPTMFKNALDNMLEMMKNPINTQK